MTFSRIALAILAVPFAWRWGPALLKGIGGLGGVFAALVSFLTPNLGRASGEHWFEFLIGIVLFWFIFKGLGLMFGFLMPKAQQFATTKGIRRFQGVCAEVGIIAVLFLAVSFLGGFMVPYQ
ncbi:MAG TPA: hypothetical protein PKX87_07895, partial [Alphaproteobacteria bacterium]|nr:hypothetical protein [Alphaproteobacteria bacterium]